MYKTQTLYNWKQRIVPITSGNKAHLNKIQLIKFRNFTRWQFQTELENNPCYFFNLTNQRLFLIQTKPLLKEIITFLHFAFLSFTKGLKYCLYKSKARIKKKKLREKSLVVEKMGNLRDILFINYGIDIAFKIVPIFFLYPYKKRTVFKV